MIKIFLPYPPSVNHYWGRAKNGGVFLKPLGQEFRKLVYYEFLKFKFPRLTGKLAIKIYVAFPDKRKRDLDNLLKATLDAIEKTGIVENDSQFQSIFITGCDVIRGGKLAVEIEQFKKEKFPNWNLAKK